MITRRQPALPVPTSWARRIANNRQPTKARSSTPKTPRSVPQRSPPRTSGVERPGRRTLGRGSPDSQRFDMRGIFAPSRTFVNGQPPSGRHRLRLFQSGSFDVSRSFAESRPGQRCCGVCVARLRSCSARCRAGELVKDGSRFSNFSATYSRSSLDRPESVSD